MLGFVSPVSTLSLFISRIEYTPDGVALFGSLASPVTISVSNCTEPFTIYHICCVERSTSTYVSPQSCCEWDATVFSYTGSLSTLSPLLIFSINFLISSGSSTDQPYVPPETLAVFPVGVVIERIFPMESYVEQNSFIHSFTFVSSILTSILSFHVSHEAFCQVLFWVIDAT